MFVSGSSLLESLSKRTNYDDVLDNVCLSAHYRAHTEFGVSGGSTKTGYRFISSCL
jgi:hypothetical protein